jgi:hypothetical protein
MGGVAWYDIPNFSLMVIVYTYMISRRMNFIKKVGCGGEGLEDSLMEEEIGVVLTQTIVTFPCGFVFGVCRCLTGCPPRGIW